MRWIVNLAQGEGVGLRVKSGPGRWDRLTAARAMPRIDMGQAVERGVSDRAEILARTRALLDDSADYAIMAHAVNLYGDGHTGR
jgi:hypothetical protein